MVIGIQNVTLKTSLTPPLFIEVPVPSQESQRSCICGSGIDFTSFYDFLLDFGAVLTVWYVWFWFYQLIVSSELLCSDFLMLAHQVVSQLTAIMNRKLNSHGQQYNQHQQNKQLLPQTNELIKNRLSTLYCYESYYLYIKTQLN